MFPNIGKLIEDGLLDLNASIETYLKDFPQKTFAGKTVDITVKDLCNHTSGIRGYFENIKKGKVCCHEAQEGSDFTTLCYFFRPNNIPFFLLYLLSELPSPYCQFAEISDEVISEILNKFYLMRGLVRF